MKALEAEAGQNEPTQNWHERISVNAAVCHGRACLRGTRVLVSAIVDNVAAGVPHEEILELRSTDGPGYRCGIGLGGCELTS
jgi:hypothetical protein